MTAISEIEDDGNCRKCNLNQEIERWKNDENHWINKDPKVNVPKTIEWRQGPIPARDVRRAGGSCGHSAIINIISRLMPELHYDLNRLIRHGSPSALGYEWRNVMSWRAFSSALDDISEGKLCIQSGKTWLRRCDIPTIFLYMPSVDDLKLMCIYATIHIKGFRGLRVTAYRYCGGHYFNVWPEYDLDGTLLFELGDSLPETTMANYFTGTYDVPGAAIDDGHRYDEFYFDFIAEVEKKESILSLLIKLVVALVERCKKFFGNIVGKCKEFMDKRIQITIIHGK